MKQSRDMGGLLDGAEPPRFHGSILVRRSVTTAVLTGLHGARNCHVRCNLDHHEIRYWALHRVGHRHRTHRSKIDTPPAVREKARREIDRKVGQLPAALSIAQMPRAQRKFRLVLERRPKRVTRDRSPTVVQRNPLVDPEVHGISQGLVVVGTSAALRAGRPGPSATTETWNAAQRAGSTDPSRDTTDRIAAPSAAGALIESCSRCR